MKVEDLPEGVSSLNARELRFVLGVLQHGQMAKAAVEAGYSESSAGAIASETLRRAEVFAFYKRCLEMVANNAEQLTGRVYERSVIFHAKALEAVQTLKDAEAWLMRDATHEEGKGAKDRAAFERKRDRAQRDEKHYAGLANQTDGLLASLLGKIAGLNVTGQINHTHGVVPVPESALAALANMRRDVHVARRDGVLSMPGTGGPN